MAKGLQFISTAELKKSKYKKGPRDKQNMKIYRGYINLLLKKLVSKKYT